MDYMRPRYVGMVRRFLVLSGLVVLGCFTMVTGGLGKMFLHLLVVLGSFFRHCHFLPVLEFVVGPLAMRRHARGQHKKPQANMRFGVASI
jgi:hypothetical protein